MYVHVHVAYVCTYVHVAYVCTYMYVVTDFSKQKRQLIITMEIRVQGTPAFRKEKEMKGKVTHPTI